MEPPKKYSFIEFDKAAYSPSPRLDVDLTIEPLFMLNDTDKLFARVVKIIGNPPRASQRWLYHPWLQVTYNSREEADLCARNLQRWGQTHDLSVIAWNDNDVLVPYDQAPHELISCERFESPELLEGRYERVLFGDCFAVI